MDDIEGQLAFGDYHELIVVDDENMLEYIKLPNDEDDAEGQQAVYRILCGGVFTQWFITMLDPNIFYKLMTRFDEKFDENSGCAGRYSKGE